LESVDSGSANIKRNERKMFESNGLNIKETSGITVVTLGNADVSSVVEIDKTSEIFVDFITSTTPSKIIVNFDDIKFFSSKALGMLLNVWKRIESYGGKMIISGINPQLSRLFRITNLDKVFKFYPDINSAITALE
jgi:anti-anti-sigma factor